MQLRSATALRLLALSLTAAPALADLVVVDGDSLVSAVAAAVDGETIYIQSDATFVGTLEWSAKDITVRGGFGYTPTVQGDPGEPAVSLSPTSVPTGATFFGLSLAPGAPTQDVPDPDAMDFAGTGNGPLFAECLIEECEVLGDVTATGTGDFELDLTLEATASPVPPR